jgi:hypothetical protein
MGLSGQISFVNSGLSANSAQTVDLDAAWQASAVGAYRPNLMTDTFSLMAERAGLWTYLTGLMSDALEEHRLRKELLKVGSEINLLA